MKRRFWLVWLSLALTLMASVVTVQASTQPSDQRKLQVARRIKHNLRMADANAIVMISDKQGDDHPMTIRNQALTVRHQD